jgi:hypothetical protein
MTSDSATGSHSGPTTPGWAVDFIGFAGIMLVLVAGMQILQGIAAILSDEVYVTGIDYVYKFDVTAWGWIHVGVGAIAVAVGFGILLGKTWGLVGGIAIASLAILSNFAFIPYYPVWSVILLAFNIVVIWACCRQLADGSPMGSAFGPRQQSGYEPQQVVPPRSVG